MARFSPRLRFSLRTLFVLVTLVCVWLGYQLNWIRQRREARTWLHTHALEYSSYPGTGDLFGDPPRQAPLSLRIFGEQGVGSIVLIQTTGQPFDPQAKIAELRRLFPEADLIEISGTVTTLRN